MSKVNDVLDKNDLKNRILRVWGDFDDGMAYLFVREAEFLKEKGKDPITILIHSAGGCADAEMCIVDEMDGLKSEGIIIRTIGMGKCYSAAATILALGSKGHRYVRPNASIMMHPISYSLGQDYQQYQDKASVFLKKLQELHNTLMSNACDKQYKKFTKDVEHGLWLTPAAAKEYGVIDGIWTGSLPSISKEKDNGKTNN